MIAVVDYNAGNVFSVISAFERLGQSVVLTSDRDTILSADRVVFPGVGYASAAMKELERRELISTLRMVRAPFLGICLGMQLMCAFSEEGNTPMLGLVDLPVRLFDRSVCRKIPQIGWNRVYKYDDPLFSGLDEGAWFFFDHSYYVPLSSGATAARTEYYGFEYTSALRKNNFHGLQFHPEKSGKAGERVLLNFISPEVEQ